MKPTWVALIIFYFIACGTVGWLAGERLSVTESRPAARCQEYPGVLVIQQRVTLSTGETNCVYAQEAKKGKF